MFIVKKNTRIITAILATVAFSIAVILGWTYLTQKTSAADMSKFDPGNIMSDAVMSNKDSMSVQQIQDFLNSKNACNNTKTYMASWYPHLQYTIRDGKFVCMAQDTFNGKSAAQIIWQVGQDYNINPQFLIVLLEKEQGLVTDTWPNHVQYRSATGFGCPDTAACDSKYFGLENQLRNAANLFRTVLNGGWSNYPVGWTYVQYNPNASCGGKVINIQNRATSALYRYTPYQPNQSAINAGYGLGDSCGAYGNRNTWALFTDWFGSSDNNSFVSLDTPRWMQVSQDNTYKFDVYNGVTAGNPLILRQQIKLVDKIFINNNWYLRTEYNYNERSGFGIKQSQLENIPYAAIEPKWVTLNTNANRSHPASRTSAGSELPKSTLIKVVDQITVDDTIYYRTEYNSKNNQDVGIHSKFTDEGINPIELEGPRHFCAKKGYVKKINLNSGEIINTSQVGIFATNKIIYNGQWYFQDKIDGGSSLFVTSESVDSQSCPSYKAFENPRNMTTTKVVDRINPYTNEKIDTLSSGLTIHFSSKILIKDSWYYRTTNNTDGGIDAVVPASSLANLN